MPTVVCQRWEESESEPGWGVTVRDDGFSLHRTEADRVAFIKAYWAEMPDATPSYYTRPSGEPYSVDLRSDNKLYKKLMGARKKGIRESGKAPEGYRKVS